MFRFVTTLVALCAVAQGHVTFSPSSGAVAGGRFFTELRVPHGLAGVYTSKIEVDIPEGVQSATPETLHGWTISIEERVVPSYESHGSTISTAPSKITYEADASEHTLHNDELLRIGLNLKFACDFPVADSENPTTTVFNDEYHLWFPIVQSFHDRSDVAADAEPSETNAPSEWIGVGEGEGSWGALTPKPAPYLVMTGTDSCESTEWHGESLEINGTVEATEMWVSQQLDAMLITIDSRLEQFAKTSDIVAECIDETEDARRRLAAGCPMTRSSDSEDEGNQELALGLGLGLGLGLLAGVVAGGYLAYRSKRVPYQKTSLDNTDQAL